MILWKNEGKTNRKGDNGTGMKVATYIYFGQEAEDAIECYQSIFGAEVCCKYHYDETMTQQVKLLGKIFHAELKIGDQNLYIADSDEYGNNTSMRFVVEFIEAELARDCLAGLVKHGRLISDFQKMPYGPTIARVEDKFGVNWDIVIC